MRAQAREKAFQLIFEKLFVKTDVSDDEEFFSSLDRQEDINFAKNIISQYEMHSQQLQDLVAAHLIGYELDRVYRVDLALIYLALTEILYIQTPFKVAISEALIISKRYSTEKSNRFINGVLSSIIKDLNK